MEGKASSKELCVANKLFTVTLDLRSNDDKRYVNFDEIIIKDFFYICEYWDYTENNLC